MALALAAGLAVIDWWAAEVRRRRVEILAKPAVIVALMAAAATLQPFSEVARWLIVGGLGFALAGDVLLIRSDRQRWFAAGLGAFLVTHLAYIAAFAFGFGLTSPVLAAAGALAIGLGSWFVGRRIVYAVRTSPNARLVIPVALYVAAISLMVVVAFATARPLAIVGALAFYASDSLLGWDRFVSQLPHRSLLVLTTYHAGQALLVLSLVS